MEAIDKQLLLLSNKLLILLLRKTRKQYQASRYKKRFWVRKIYKERQTFGEYHSLVKEMMLLDKE